MFDYKFFRLSIDYLGTIESEKKITFEESFLAIWNFNSRINSRRISELTFCLNEIIFMVHDA